MTCRTVSPHCLRRHAFDLPSEKAAVVRIPANSVCSHVWRGTARTYTVDARLECHVVCLRKVKGYWGGEGLGAVIGVPQALARKNIPLTLLLRRPLLLFFLFKPLSRQRSRTIAHIRAQNVHQFLIPSRNHAPGNRCAVNPAGGRAGCLA